MRGPYSVTLASTPVPVNLEFSDELLDALSENNLVGIEWSTTGHSLVRSIDAEKKFSLHDAHVSNPVTIHLPEGPLHLTELANRVKKTMFLRDMRGPINYDGLGKSLGVKIEVPPFTTFEVKPEEPERTERDRMMDWMMGKPEW